MECNGNEESYDSLVNQSAFFMNLKMKPNCMEHRNITAQQPFSHLGVQLTCTVNPSPLEGCFQASITCQCSHRITSLEELLLGGRQFRSPPVSL